MISVCLVKLIPQCQVNPISNIKLIIMTSSDGYLSNFDKIYVIDIDRQDQ